jgi:hypothetical protein
MNTSPCAKLIIDSVPVDHAVAQRDQGVDAAELQRVERLLQPVDDFGIQGRRLACMRSRTRCVITVRRSSPR